MKGLIRYERSRGHCNKIGRREIILVWLVFGSISGTFFAFGSHSPVEMSFWWAMFYFFTVGHMGAFVPFMMESFPTRSRGTGASFISFAVWGGLLLAGLTSQLFVNAMGVELSTFLWLGVSSFIAFLCAIGTRRVKPGVELEEIIN